MEQDLINQSESEELMIYCKKASLLLIILSIAGILSISFMKKLQFSETLNALIFMLIIDMIIICYMGIFRGRVFVKRHAWWMIGVSYILSIFCMYPGIQGDYIPYWIIGGVILACIIDLNMGLIISYSLTVLTASIYGILPKQLVVQLILCSLLCILTGFLKSINQLIYVLVIAISACCTLLLASNGFNIKSSFSLSGKVLILFNIFILVLSYGLERLENKWIILYGVKPDHSEDMINKQKHIEEADITQNKDVMNSEAINSEEIIDSEKKSILQHKNIQDNNMQDINMQHNTLQDKETGKIDSVDLIDFDLQSIKEEFEKQKRIEEMNILKKQLKDAINPNNPLLKRMKDEAPKLYMHGKKVADLSRNAAMIVKADDIIAYVGGFYHEVGRLNGKDIIEEGIKLVREHSFPVCIEDIIRQHNFKSENPKSKEAAIIMLTDNILAAINFCK